MKKSEKEFVEAIKLLGFTINSDREGTDGEFSDSDIVHSDHFVGEITHIEIEVTNHTVDGLVMAIYNAGIEEGQEYRTRQISGKISELKSLVGI